MAPPPPADLMANTTFDKQNIDYLTDNFEGDYLGFTAYYEAAVVSPAIPLLFFLFGCLTLSCIGASYRSSPNPRRVSVLWLWGF